ncbi:hypothetical protein VTK73DRAFT_2582 [Phialemonium thermophilum]|uniref:Amidase domain-containing protein n=1 Tax=Phialemonium thermophilum TaxID=223376 RepID=A0ABR3X3N4_9PEZI
MLASGLCRALALSAVTPSLSQRLFKAEQTCFDSPFGVDELLPPLLDATLDDLSAGLEAGLFTSVDLVSAYIARILEVNSTLKAVTQINPDALAIAADLDAARSNGTTYGPLHGIPILLKNNIATDDAMETTAGSYALLGARVPEDSTVAAKLRRAGAVLLGKTNLSQWANYRSLNSSNGWSAHGGQTEGAYYPGQDPSGSSSGSGVASSLGLAWASLGTETDGSILSPAGLNNVVGIKPTVGLTSRYLVVPISEHQDTVGPMARTVRDAAYLLAAIAGEDARDNYTSAIPFAAVPDYVAACDGAALQGTRIGVPRNLIRLDGRPELQPIVDAFDDALAVLRDAGAAVVDHLILPGYDMAREADYEGVVLHADFVHNIEQYLARITENPHNVTTLADLQRFTHSFPLEDWPERDTLIWEEALNLTRPYFDTVVTAEGRIGDAPWPPAWLWGNYTAQVHCAGPLGIEGALSNYSLDALVLPTVFASSMPAWLGSPAVTVPLGRFPDDTPVVLAQPFRSLNATAPNVPFGISFLAERFSEEKLIGLAYAFEQRTLVRRQVVPYLQPRTELVDVVKRGNGGRC